MRDIRKKGEESTEFIRELNVKNVNIVKSVQKKGWNKTIKKSGIFKERKQLANKMKKDEAKKIFRQRQKVVEPAIGNYKEKIGFREFLTRGLKSVKNEFNLVCTSVNLRKMWIYSNKNDQLERKKEINGTFHFKKNGMMDLITSNKVTNFQIYN